MPLSQRDGLARPARLGRVFLGGPQWWRCGERGRELSNHEVSIMCSLIRISDLVLL